MAATYTGFIVIPFSSKIDKDKGLEAICWEPRFAPSALHLTTVQFGKNNKKVCDVFRHFDEEYQVLLTLEGSLAEIEESFCTMKVRPDGVPYLLKATVFILPRE